MHNGAPASHGNRPQPQAGTQVVSSSASKSSLPSLVLAAIGVVYGDIGTSVLYAMKEVFASGHLTLTTDNIYGILSLIFWTLTIIVSLKYVVLVLRADNEGEGGLIAMLALASQAVKDKPRLRGGIRAGIGDGEKSAAGGYDHGETEQRLEARNRSGGLKRFALG